MNDGDVRKVPWVNLPRNWSILGYNVCKLKDNFTKSKKILPIFRIQ